MVIFRERQFLKIRASYFWVSYNHVLSSIAFGRREGFAVPNYNLCTIDYWLNNWMIQNVYRIGKES